MRLLRRVPAGRRPVRVRSVPVLRCAMRCCASATQDSRGSTETWRIHMACLRCSGTVIARCQTGRRPNGLETAGGRRPTAGRSKAWRAAAGCSVVSAADDVTLRIVRSCNLLPRVCRSRASRRAADADAGARQAQNQKEPRLAPCSTRTRPGKHVGSVRGSHLRATKSHYKFMRAEMESATRPRSTSRARRHAGSQRLSHTAPCARAAPGLLPWPWPWPSQHGSGEWPGCLTWRTTDGGDGWRTADGG